jgi:hypothetical protein
VRPLAPAIAHLPLWSAASGRPALLSCSVACPEPLRSVRLHVRPDGRPATALEMRPGRGHAVFEAEVPGELLAAGSRLSYWIEAVSASGRASRLPPRTLLAVDAARSAPPAITHEPVAAARPGTPIAIRAGVVAALPLRALRLHYRYTSQYYDYNVVDMEQDGGAGGGASRGQGPWVAEIPGDYVVGDWDIMYFIEAIDEAGRGALAPSPDPVASIPYWVIRVQR